MVDAFILVLQNMQKQEEVRKRSEIISKRET